MDTTNITKLVAAVCVAGLVFLFGKWGAETVFSQGEAPMAAEDGHGEDAGHGKTVQAYVIETESGDSGSEEPSGPPAWILAMAEADPAAGESVFNKCKACHALEPGKNGTGPSLAGIVGHTPGAVEGFSYSSAMVEYGAEHVWDEENLFTFLGDVKGTVPGTKMSFAGIRKEEDRADLIAFLMNGDFDAAKYAAMAAEEAAGAEGDGDAAAEESHGDEGAVEAGAEAGGEAMALPAGDAEVGAKVFNKCKACHSPEPGKNGTGPSLAGIVGHAVGAVEGFSYSKGMIAFGEAGNVWDEATLFQFLGDVRGTVKGTKMSFAGIAKEEDRLDLIAYLATLN